MFVNFIKSLQTITVSKLEKVRSFEKLFMNSKNITYLFFQMSTKVHEIKKFRNLRNIYEFQNIHAFYKKSKFQKMFVNSVGDFKKCLRIQIILQQYFS